MRTSIEIIDSNLKNNIESLKKIYSKVGYVLKSNAYGHGGFVLSKAISYDQEAIIFLAHLDELNYIELPVLCRIVIMSPDFFQEKEVLFYLNTYHCEITIYDMTSLKLFLTLKKDLNYNPPIHIKVDTGMHRLGFLAEEINNLLDLIKNTDLNITGLFSHCSETNQYNISILSEQTLLFNTILNQFKNIYPKIESHLYSSGAIDIKNKFDICRAGSFIYGLWKSSEQKKRFLESYPDIDFKQIIRWKSKIIQIKKVKKDSYIGYGTFFKAPKDMVIAILPVGYEDGYDRNLSGKSVVVVNEKYAPVCGMISMSLMTIDITDIDCVEGDAVLLTDPNHEKILLDNLGKLLEISSIALSSRISKNIQRYMVNE
jgi:alanine racemase